MKDLDKIFFGILITINGCFLMYIYIFGSNRLSISVLITGLISLFYLPIEHRREKRQLAEMKIKFNLDGDFTLEELEKIRIERDYQDNFVKNLDID